MKNKQLQLLKKIVETPSPTGSEVAVASIVRERLASIADEIKTDTMGSVHTSYFGSIHHREEGDGTALGGGSIYQGSPDGETAPLTLMLAAHMDEIGLMVTYISEDGFLSFSALGGVDAAILPGMRVDVHTEGGILRGVVGRKPIHLIENDDRKTVTPMDKLVIDLGMPVKKVKKKVRVGDSITFGVGFERFGQDMAVSRALDDKVGVFIATQVMENLAENVFYRGNFIAAITVQEEIGTRGAITSAHSVKPDVALAFDVTHATDYPGIDKGKYGDIVCGGGPVIARGPNINPAVFDRLVKAAEDENIPYQLEAEPSVTGTDARAIQVTRGGIPTGLISIPLRYMHTPTEVISLDDVEDAIRLITRFAMDLDEATSFVPGYAERYIAKANREDIENARSAARLQSVSEALLEDEDYEIEESAEEEEEITPDQTPFGRQQSTLSEELKKSEIGQRSSADEDKSSDSSKDSEKAEEAEDENLKREKDANTTQRQSVTTHEAVTSNQREAASNQGTGSYQPIQTQNYNIPASGYNAQNQNYVQQRASGMYGQTQPSTAYPNPYQGGYNPYRMPQQNMQPGMQNNNINVRNVPIVTIDSTEDEDE